MKSAFQRSLAVLCAIGLETYLRLEVVVPRIQTPFPRSPTQELSTAVQSASTGLSPSPAPRSRGVLVDWRGIKGGPTTPHVPLLSGGIRFAVRRFQSPLLTASQLVSFPAGTQMFHFPAFANLTVSEGSPIRKSPVQRPHAPRRSLSQLVTSFIAVSSQAVHLQSFGTVISLRSNLQDSICDVVASLHGPHRTRDWRRATRRTSRHRSCGACPWEGGSWTLDPPRLRWRAALIFAIEDRSEDSIRCSDATQ